MELIKAGFELELDLEVELQLELELEVEVEVEVEVAPRFCAFLLEGVQKVYRDRNRVLLMCRLRGRLSDPNFFDKES